MKFTFWNCYLGSTIVIVCICLFLLLAGCGQNTRHSIGAVANPFAKGDKMEDSIKLNYKIIFGKVRPKEDDDD